MFYWVLNEEREYEQALGIHCDGIMTDRPTALVAYLKERRLR